MWKRKVFGKRLVSLLLASLLGLLPLFASDEVMIKVPESTLIELETTLKQQLSLIEQQENKLKILDETLQISENALNTASTSLQIYETTQKKNDWKLGLTVGGICISIGVPLGIIVGVMVSR